MAEDELKINVEAESKILSSMTESGDLISSTEKVKSSFIDIPEPEVILMASNIDLEVEGEIKTSPRIENVSSIIEQDRNVLLEAKTNNLENLVDKNILPAVTTIYNEIKNKMDNDKDPRPPLEERITVPPKVLFFDEKLNKFTDAPYWA
jgi:hypothetical protein